MYVHELCFPVVFFSKLSFLGLLCHIATGIWYYLVFLISHYFLDLDVHFDWYTVVFHASMISLWWTPGVFVEWLGPGHTRSSFLQLQLQIITPVSWLSLRHWMLWAGLGLYQPASAHLSYSQFGPQLSPFVASATPQLVAHQLRECLLLRKPLCLLGLGWTHCPRHRAWVLLAGSEASLPGLGITQVFVSTGPSFYVVS